MYEDLGLLTADPDLGADVGDLFNYLTGYSRHADYRKLLVAPVTFRAGMLDEIERETEAGPDGRIVIKVNGLTDPEMIDALYRASVAGVPIDLVVRGLCCLRPGVPGLSETIPVRSIVGQFLEHSRIYRFGGEGRRPLRLSSVRPTSWSATSTGASRCSPPYGTAASSNASWTSWPSAWATTPTPGSSGPTTPGPGWQPGSGSASRTD